MSTTFASDVYPRYDYARRYVRPLITRCQQLLNECGLNYNARIPNFQSITFLFEDPSLLNDGRWLTPRCSEPRERSNLEDLDTDPVIRVFRYHKDMEPDCVEAHECVFILKDHETCDISKAKAYCVTQNDFPVCVGRLLEGYVFGWLRRRVDVLWAFKAALQPEDKYYLPTDQDSDANQRLNKSLQAMHNGDIKASTGLVASDTENAEHFHIKRGMFVTKTDLMHSPANRVKEKQQEIEDFIVESMAMFLRHKVPSDELPDIDYTPTSVNDRLYQEIRYHIPNIKGCGMRYGTLCIELDTTYTDQITIKKHLDDVRDLCKVKYNIHYTEFRENVYETLLSGRYRVGTKISTGTSYGTLGGFAMIDEKLYGLLAKHVVGDGGELFYVGDNDRLIKIGAMVAPVDNPWVDIATARITVPVHDHSFRDPDGQSKPSKLFELEIGDISILSGQPVYIWGANSQPGHGKLTMVRQVDDIKLIEIEDNGEEPAFAVEGDSGAIICAEDPDGNCVTVIGMLMGIRHISSDGDAKPRKYAGFFLQDGLNQLQRGHTEQISLC